MPKRFLLFVLSVVLLASSAFAYPRVGPSGQRSDSSSSKTSSSKTVHVRTYTRKDGTVVQGYDRSAPGTKASSSTAQGKSLTATPALRDSQGKIKRIAAAKNEFERETGYTHGRKGYLVYHIVPLP